MTKSILVSFAHIPSPNFSSKHWHQCYLSDLQCTRNTKVYFNTDPRRAFLHQIFSSPFIVIVTVEPCQDQTKTWNTHLRLSTTNKSWECTEGNTELLVKKRYHILWEWDKDILESRRRESHGSWPHHKRKFRTSLTNNKGKRKRWRGEKRNTELEAFKVINNCCHLPLAYPS